MAQRLATEYVKTCLELTEAEMLKFIQMFTVNQALLQVKVLENGSQEVVFLDEKGEEIVLSFERKKGKYVCTGTCRLSSHVLADLMRKAVSDFKGDAIVKRIYLNYVMEYHYNRGSVVKIMEIKDSFHKIIYEYKNTLGRLEMLFRNQDAEIEIEQIQSQIDQLLDLRNDMIETELQNHVDLRLKKLTHRLFVLEA
jgi:hypothetical protein